MSPGPIVIVRPLRFILPHEKGIRPAWLVRMGLFLYDNLATRIWCVVADRIPELQEHITVHSALLTAVLGVVQTWLSTTVGQRVMHGLRTDVFVHLQRQSLAFFTRTRGGEVQSRLTHDIGAMQSVVTTAATSIASNVTTAVGTAVAMAALSWRLSLLSLVVLPPAIWLTRRVAQMRRALSGGLLVLCRALSLPTCSNT